MESIADWPLERKLQEALTRSLPKLGPGVREQVSALLTKEALAVMAVVLVAWVVSHAFGVGEIIDLVILGVGAVAIGMAVFEGVDHLYEFAARAHGARTTEDLDASGDHFAKAVSILGIQAVLAVLLRGAPRSYRGGVNKRGPVTPVGQAYRPTITWSKYVPGYGRLVAGQGWTTSWGNIVVSSRGSATTRQLVLLHEKVHQTLTPTAYRLRDFRISNRDASYRYSSLSRFLEEALAETYAQARVHGVREALSALRFPLNKESKYVYLFRRGGYDSKFEGMGVLTELLGIASSTIAVEGTHYDLFMGPGVREPAKEQRIAAPVASGGASGSW